MRDTVSLRGSRLREVGWKAFFSAFLLIVFGFVCFIIVTNALYLGWKDFVWYISRARTWINFGLTVGTASAATLFSMCVGIPVGYALSRLRFPFPKLVEALLDLPLMVPPAAIGMFLLGFFRQPPANLIETVLGIKVIHALPGVVVAQMAVTVSFCIRMMKSSFDWVNPRFEHVSRSLGASLPMTFFKVTLPMAKNGLLAGLIIVWARAVAEYEALMLFVGAIQGRTDVMPLAVYLDVTAGKLEWAITESFLCVAVAVMSVYAFKKVGKRGYLW